MRRPTNRMRLVTVVGEFVGMSWSGYRATLPVDQLLNRDLPFTQAIERLVKSKGDFESCQLSHDTEVHVLIARARNGRSWEYARWFPITRFPSVAKFVAKPRRT